MITLDALRAYFAPRDGEPRKVYTGLAYHGGEFGDESLISCPFLPTATTDSRYGAGFYATLNDPFTGAACGEVFVTFDDLAAWCTRVGATIPTGGTHA